MSRERSTINDARQACFIIFELGDATYAVAIDAVAEVLPLPALASEPGASSILAGFLNLRGEAIPVLRLSRILEMPDPAIDLSTSVILLRQSGQRVGLLVSRVRQIVSVAPAAIMALPSSANAMMATAARIDDKIVPVVAPEGLLLEQERRRIAELHAVRQRRLHELQEAAA